MNNVIGLIIMEQTMRNERVPNDAMQSCPWVGLTHGLGWVEIFQFLVD